jgi:hypothetical protein
MKLVSPVFVVFSRRLVSASGRPRNSGRAERTSAATPTAFGEDIEVPWSQPRGWPSSSRHAVLNADEAKGSVQRSPFLERAPNDPQPP